MLRRSHNEVINIFMNKINHALTLRHSTSESQMWPYTGELLRPPGPRANIQPLGISEYL